MNFQLIAKHSRKRNERSIQKTRRDGEGFDFSGTRDQAGERSIYRLRILTSFQHGPGEGPYPPLEES